MLRILPRVRPDRVALRKRGRSKLMVYSKWPPGYCDRLCRYLAQQTP